MAYNKFQADQLFTGHTILDANHVLITNETGIIQEIVSPADAGEDIQKFSGILTPGHINCHCHLELSHMRNRIASGKGLTDFIASVMRSPQVDQLEREEQMALADKEMFDNGIIAVGDISNQPYSLQQKIKSPLHWYNFLEITNLDDSRAKERVNLYKEMAETFVHNIPAPVEAALSPHAIYSVSRETFRLINKNTAGKTITIHNQECIDEDVLLKRGEGKFLSFYEGIGRKELPVEVSGKSSIQTWLPYFNNRQTILLVHNTYMTEEDIIFANAYAARHGLKLVYCLCPNANVYIEQTLPPIDLFIKHHCTIVFDTDSYGSNWQLNITKEAALIHERFPHVPLLHLLQWITLNGAKALHWDNTLGSFEKGKQPGVVLVENDLSKSKRIL